MDEKLRTLLSLLDLETIEVNVFLGRSMPTGGRGVFGGQVVGQALVAAERTVEGPIPHSLHGYFLLPGDGAPPSGTRWSGSETGGASARAGCRRSQARRIIFSMIASFQ